MNAPTYINSTHRALARNPGGLTLEEIAGKIRAKAKKAAEQVRELHDLGMIQTTEEAGQPVYKLDDPSAVAPASEINDVAEVGDTDVVELAGGVFKTSEPIDSMGIPLSCGRPLCSPGDHHPLCKLHTSPAGDSEGGEADAQATADFATTPELQYLAPEDYEMPPADPALLAAANRALGEQLEVITAERDALRKSLDSAPAFSDDQRQMRAMNAKVVWPGQDAGVVSKLAELQAERDDLRARLDAVTQQSIADTDALTAQIEHLRAELAERDSHLHKITGDTGRSDIAQRLIDHNDDRLYHEADMLMYEASDAITMLEHERDQLRAELETARAEAIALKTLEGAMPGFGTAHDAQRIASLTAELQALRTSSANAINEADRLRAELATERQAREALQEQSANERAPSGYLVCATKRKPRRINDGERAKFAALAAVRAGAARAEVLAVVPVGTARRGAEWRGA